MNFPGFNFSPRKSRLAGASSSMAGRLGRGLEAVLLLLLAVQLARLGWAVVTPTGPVGDWQARSPTVPSAQARQALFAAFDPFYRTANVDGGVQQVTSLALQLYGIRLNEGSGLGSAIIADEAGAQRSYAVGDAIAPGVTLKSVAYDHVVIERGGISETLYMDQSRGGSVPLGDPGPSAGTPGQGPEQGPGQGQGTPPPPPGPDGGAPLTSGDLANALDLAPRLENGAVTGLVVSARGDDARFAQAGFRPGDIIVQVNGRPVRDTADIMSLRSAITPGARLSLMVERGASTVPVALILPGKK